MVRKYSARDFTNAAKNIADTIGKSSNADLKGMQDAGRWEAVIRFTAAFEGAVEYMYNNWPSKSTSQDVTIGIGCKLIRGWQDCIPYWHYFYRKGDASQTPINDPATVNAQLEKDYAFAYKTPREDSPTGLNVYETGCQLRLSDAGILQFMGDRLVPKLAEGINPHAYHQVVGLTKEQIDARKKREAKMKQDLTGFASWPAQAQIAYVAWSYGRIAYDYPKMTAALAACDFDLAGHHSTVGGWDRGKMLNLKRLFYNAARMWEQAHLPDITLGKWVYDPQHEPAKRLPTIADNGVVTLEQWKPWTSTDPNTGAQIQHTTPPPTPTLPAA
jgi:hypothetical protein